MSLLERVAAALFGPRSSADHDPAERQLIADLTELVVDEVEPRVRLASRYREKLAPSIGKSIAHLRVIGQAPFEPVLLARAAWSQDSRVNAFFARPDDVPACLGRSRELRAFFDDPANADAREAFALLGMRMTEMKVFAPSLLGDKVIQDVAQTTVGFADHRLIAPAGDIASTRLEVGKRIIRRLAQIALGRIVAIDMKGTELQEHKAYLAARLRLLNLARDGMEGLVKDPATIGEDIKAVEREMKETLQQYAETKGSLATLEGYLGHIVDVFGNASEHVSVRVDTLRLTRMGYKADASTTEPVNEVPFVELAVSDGLSAVIAIARCPRDEMPPKEDLIARAERML